MRLQGLTNAFTLMRQTKVAERKRGTELLKEILEDDAVVAALDQNSASRDAKNLSTTWTVVFNEVLSSYDKETEASRRHALSSIDRIFQRAISASSGPFLPWHKIFLFLIARFKSPDCGLYLRTISHMLNSFLLHDVYSSQLTDRHWNDLIPLLMQWAQEVADESVPSILDNLNISIANGSNHPGVITVLRKEASKFFEFVFLSEKRPKGVSSNVSRYLMGFAILSDKNALEFRGILCRVGELVLPEILNLNSSRDEDNTSIYRVLLQQLMLHAPADVDSTSNAFHTYDAYRWRDVLGRIYTYAIDSIEALIKRKMMTQNKKFPTPKLLLQLAARSTKQVCDDWAGFPDETGDNLPPSKRIKTHKSFQDIISDVSRMSPNEDQLVWISYFSVVISNYPELIDSQEMYETMYSIGLQLLKSSFNDHEELYRFMRCLLVCEKHLLQHGIVKHRRPWEVVWDACIRNLSTNDWKLELLELLKQLIFEVETCNVNLLPLAYISHTVPPSKMNLQLLLEYLSKVSLPSTLPMSYTKIAGNFENTRTSLIRWIVTDSDSRLLGSEALVATILCCLIVKRSHVIAQLQNAQYKFANVICPTEPLYQEFEKTMLGAAFVHTTHAFAVPPPAIPCVQISSVKTLPILPDVTENFLSILQTEYDELTSTLPAKKTPQFVKKLSDLQYHVSLYFHVLNIIIKFDVGGKEILTFKMGLEKLIDKSFQKYSNITQDYFALRPEGFDQVEVADILHAMRNLVYTKYFCEDTKRLLAQKIPQHLRETLKKLFRNSLLQIDKMNNSSEIPRSVIFTPCESTDPVQRVEYHKQCQRASVQALRCLIEYGFMCNHKSELFQDIIKSLNEEHFTTANLVLFETAHGLISRIGPILSTVEMREVIPYVVVLLQNLCRGYYTLPMCSLRLWELFTCCINIFADSNDVDPVQLSQTRKNLMTLVGALASSSKGNNTTNRSININVCSASLRFLSELSKYDRSLTWTLHCPRTGANANVWILEDTHGYLSSPSNQIRLLAVETVVSIFVNADPPTANQYYTASQLKKSKLVDAFVDKRVALYEAVSDLLTDTFRLSGLLTADELMEEGVNRTASALLCLTRLLTAYQYMAKITTLGFFKVVRCKNIKSFLAKRALAYTQENPILTLTSYLPYIMKKWLKDRPLDQFPYDLIACNSVIEFYKKFEEIITVELFEKNDEETFRDFVQKLNTTVVSLLVKYHCVLLARHAPGLVAAEGLPSCASAKKAARLTENHERLIAAVGGTEENQKLMMGNLAKVVIHLISLTFEPHIPLAWECPNLRLPEPPQPHFYDEETIKSSLIYLRGISPHKEFSIIEYLVTSSPNHVYNILLTLVIRIHDAQHANEKFWRLHHFSFFVKLLVEEDRTVVDQMKEYLMQFIIHAYLRLLAVESDKCENLTKSIIFLLSEFVQYVANMWPEEMIPHFSIVVSRLVSAATKHRYLYHVIKKSLDVLIVKHTTKFHSCIVALSPFPDNELFKEFNEIYVEQKYGGRRAEWPLQEELRRYLEQAETVPNDCGTKERMIFLRDLLSSRKRDLEKLVKDLEGKMFSGDCDNDILHCLIQQLLKIITNSREDDIVVEACKCLGEIGPVDLSVLVLPKNERRTLIPSAEKGLQAIIEKVASYLVAEELALVRAAGTVLHSILHISDCNDVLMHSKFERLLLILKPFISHTPNQRNIMKISAAEIENGLNTLDTNDSMTYTRWITGITCVLIDCVKPPKNQSYSTFFARLRPLCAINVEFCEDILPYLTYCVLCAGQSNSVVRKHLSSYVRMFFGKSVAYITTLSENEARNSQQPDNSLLNSLYLNKLTVNCLLRVIQFLRLHELPLAMSKANSGPTPWESNFWLDLNYMDLCKTAQFCGAHLSSILFMEIYSIGSDTGAVQTSESQEDSDDESESIYHTQTSTLNSKTRPEMEKIMLKGYNSIGDPDAIYGCGSARFSDFQSSIDHLQQRKQWSRILSSYDSKSAPSSDGTIAKSLNEMGLWSTLWTYFQGIESKHGPLDPKMSEIQYECSWRLGQWDLNSEKAVYVKDNPLVATSAQTCLQKLIYEGIQAGMSKDLITFNEILRRGFKSIVYDLRRSSLESSENLYGFLSQFQTLRVIEDFFKTERDNVLFKWKLQDTISSSNFKFQEPVLFVRSVLLKSLCEMTKKPAQNLMNSFDDCMLDLVVKARDCGRLEFAEKCVESIISSNRTIQKELEIARNHWARNDKDLSRHILSRLLKKTNQDICEIYPMLLLIYGEMQCETLAERPKVILEKYLVRACDMFDAKKNLISYTYGKANFITAKYADLQYQNVNKYIRSDLFQDKVLAFETGKDEAVIAAKNNDADYKRSLLLLKKQGNIDQEEINATFRERDRFLLMALKHYFNGLLGSNDNDMLIFRAVALWTENCNEDGTCVEKINKFFEEGKMPSHKYIMVLHQLCARLTTKSQPMSSILCDILSKCAKQHPHHTLPVLLTQAMLHKDRELTGSRLKPHSDDRVLAAKRLIDTLRRDSGIQNLVAKMEKLWDALIHLANEPEDNRTHNIGVQRTIPSSAPLKHLKPMEDLSVPTVNVPVIPSGKYSNKIVGISKLFSSYSLVGGINSPKKVTCRGTNGGKYNMLLKGRDDLRQDAVMQQVFGVMNNLLQTEKQTKARRLRIRTYKVVPLSQRSGILEWCENTQTFGEYLVGSPQLGIEGAHTVYRSTDMTPLECRKKMNEVKDTGDKDAKYEAFITICENFKPVFRHFFFENFKEPGMFFERRLAYIRSVATSSMVGYILGLGDRHVLNILVDKTTAEFIHIDLGVAFEQGRLLPTPETIPFRLTRDVVDGMGFCGVEGGFRKSSEMTLNVLRLNADIIVTILEVLLYDPLYMWTITADRMQKVQPPDRRGGKSMDLSSVLDSTTGQSERNNSAVRVLTRMKQKLLGIEEGAASSGCSLSVEGQVSVLIQRAMDAELLSRLFPGWQPYL